MVEDRTILNKIYGEESVKNERNNGTVYSRMSCLQ